MSALENRYACSAQSETNADAISDFGDTGGHSEEPMEPHLGTSSSSHIQEHDVFDQQVLASNCNTQHVSVDSGARDDYGVIARDLLHLLPEKRDCERLVQVFFDRVEWIHHIVY